METLKSGDIRKKGDEQRGRGSGDGGKSNNDKYWGEWRKTELIGHEILPSDMMHLEFRRPK